MVILWYAMRKNLIPMQWPQDNFYFQYLQSTRSQQSFVDHVPSIRHSNNENVIQLLDAINFGQKLIDHGIVHSGISSDTASGFANGINFIKNNDVQTTVGSELKK